LRHRKYITAELSIGEGGLHRERTENKDIITHTSPSFSGHAIVRAYYPRAHSRSHVCGRRRCTDLNFAHVHCVASAYIQLALGTSSSARTISRSYYFLL